MRLAEFVAGHSDRPDPSKASQRAEHTPGVVEIVHAPSRECLSSKVLYTLRARLHSFDVSALDGVRDEAINPVGPRPELNRSDRERWDPLIAVEQITRDVPIDVRPCLSGQSLQVIDIISSQRNVECVIDQSSLRVLDVFGQVDGTIENRLADRSERQLVELLARDRDGSPPEPARSAE